MKISYRYLVGRFVNPETNRPVNIHKGVMKDRGFDVYFYTHRQKKVLVSESFRQWKRAGGDREGAPSLKALET